jgi:hypothetical protein
MKLSLPLSMLRIWCRQNGAWLSWVTKSGERYFVEGRGYFVELIDGSLAQIHPRVAFPVIDRFPALMLSDIAEQPEFGAGTRFISVPVSGARSGKPRAISLELLLDGIEQALPAPDTLSQMEYYLFFRLYESGIAKPDDLMRAHRKRENWETFGQALIRTGVCSWEFLLAVCMDCPSATKLDPPHAGTMIQRRDWELTGEILVAMGKLSRRNLERALQIKRDGSQAIGEILESIGACKKADVDACLKIQNSTRKEHGAEVALIGQLLVSRGVISRDAFEQALRHQRVGRQSLEKLLIAMGICTQMHIDDFVQKNDWHAFQSEIDDVRLGRWLVQTGVIKQQQLDEALRVQTRGRQVLGELLVSMRFCSPNDVSDILDLQKKMRAEHASDLEKLGSLMIKERKITQDDLDHALKMQSIGRQPIGCILAAIKACKPQDVGQALQLQGHWREYLRPTGDRLGELLLQRGLIDERTLQSSLNSLPEAQQPLGHFLVERFICRPEDIIETLVERDRQRQIEFLTYLRKQIPPSFTDEPADMQGPVERKHAETFMNRLSGWMRRPATPDPR